MSLSYYYRGKLILCSTNVISSIPIFRTSRFLDQWTLGMDIPGLTILAKNGETWLLPQRSWGRSEVMTETSNSVIETYFWKMWGVFSHFFLYLHLKCAFANILLISFIFNINSYFVFALLLLLIFDFIHFCLENCKDIGMTSKCLCPSPDFLRPSPWPSCLKLNKLIV